MVAKIYRRKKALDVKNFKENHSAIGLRTQGQQMKTGVTRYIRNEPYDPAKLPIYIVISLGFITLSTNKMKMIA